MRQKKSSMSSKVVSLTIPNVITNITVPLLGMVDLAIVGHIGGGSYIGAIAIGTAIFNLVYWNFGFLRMGTTGMVAQAYGARDLKECIDLLIRALVIALFISITLIALQYPVFGASRYFMNISDNVYPIVSDYFFVRIWAAPATISLYVFKGWFIGMQNSRIPMFIAIIINIVNITLSLLFAYTFDMGISGVALGTVIAQYSGVAIALIYLLRYYKKIFHYISIESAFQWDKILRFFNINKDIFLRTFCLVVVFTFFTSASSKENDTILGANTLLMQLFTLFSYIMDGFAYSAESLTGKYYGAKNISSLNKSIKVVNMFGLIFSALFTLIYFVALHPILSIFTNDESILELAMSYRWWVIAIPFSGYLAFIYDGISGGMTKTKIMRNTIFVSTFFFFASYYTLSPILGNDALWLSLILFLLGRGLLQMFYISRVVIKL